MANTLAQPVELADFPGAPFTQGVVDSAVGAVRLEAGWHIAPQVTETIKVHGSGGTMLILPTLRLTTVTEVRDVSGDTPVVLGGWRKSTKGILTRDAGWPCGIEVIEVDLTHGYTTTPPELFPVIAYFSKVQQVDPTVSQEALGSWSRTFRASSGDQSGLPLAVLSRFTVQTGFA